MPVAKLTYWQRLRNALTGTPDPQFIFGLEDADRLLSAPGVAAFEGGDGAVPVSIVATARLLGANVTVAEEAAAHIQAYNDQIETTKADNEALQTAMDERIKAIEEAKLRADQEARQTVTACVDEVRRAARVEQFFAPAL